MRGSYARRWRPIGTAAKRKRRTALKLLQELRAAGYCGGYSQLTAWLRRFRQAFGHSATARAFVPLKFALGEAFQFDWSEESLRLGGLHRKVQWAHLKLCASRAFFLSAYPTRNRYSVPWEWVGQMVSLRRYPERVEVVLAQATVASHARLFERGQTRYDWRHYIPVAERKPGVLRNGAPFAGMPASLLDLQKALLRREGGDRVMAKVLSAVPVHGLEAVRVAVELVLQSGAVNAEHVLNVIARLRPDAPRATVESALQLKEAPRADTARYDGLRAEGVEHA